MKTPGPIQDLYDSMTKFNTWIMKAFKFFPSLTASTLSQVAAFSIIIISPFTLLSWQ